VDGTNSNNRLDRLQYPGQIVAAFLGRRLIGEQGAKMVGRTFAAAGLSAWAFLASTLRSRVWFNPDLAQPRLLRPRP